MPSLTAADLLGIQSIREHGGLPGSDIYSALVGANNAANGAGVIWIPPGAYRLGTSFSPSAGVLVVIASGVTITGAGSLAAGLGAIQDLRGNVAGGELATAGAAVTAKRFVASNSQQAAVDSLTVIGVALNSPAEAGDLAVASAGLQLVTADAPLAATDPVKVGTAGRATKHTTAQTVIQTAIAGEATAFTQAAARLLQVRQAVDVAADRGRGIVIEGSDGAGAAITETINLHATDSSTPVAGVVSFTKISGVYTADGAALGAQSVRIETKTAGTLACTLANGTSEIGADIPAQTQQAFCNEVTITGPNADATFVTIVGIDSADAVARERCTLDGASPSKITSTTVWRLISRICLGEFTDAAAGAVKTNSTTDTAGMKCGVVVTAAAARGDDAIVLAKPNA